MTRHLEKSCSLAEKLRRLLKEENQKKKTKKGQSTGENFQRTKKEQKFEKIEIAVANISNVNHYDSKREVGIKCNDSHSRLGLL